MKRINKRALYESIMRDVAKVVKKRLNEEEEYEDHKGPYGKDFETDEEWLLLIDMARDLCNAWEEYWNSNKVPVRVKKLWKQSREEDIYDYDIVDDYFYPFADKWVKEHVGEYGDLETWIDGVRDLETPMGEREISPLDGNQYIIDWGD